jgi:hypothetical protein
VLADGVDVEVEAGGDGGLAGVRAVSLRVGVVGEGGEDEASAGAEAAGLSGVERPR